MSYRDVLRELQEEFASKQRSVDELLLLSPEELDDYQRWTEDLSQRISALRNAVRGKNRA